MRGFSTFDVVLDDALKLDYPVMVVCTNFQYFFSTLEDCLSIYDSPEKM